ncbi:hypothetical protein ABZ408_40155 [Streptomyces tibetensis]|uniref:Secreted protein n=1 Tax=Streptomyces tibetensis TaxID=2382123 RepID=A0ABW6NAK4_9ACTN
MTEGWGAVAAALIAGVVAVAGSFIGIYVGRRQVQDEAHIEHEQWLRDQRQEAYAAFLAKWDAAYTGMKQEVARLTEQWEAMEEHGLDISVDEDDLERAQETAEHIMQPMRAVQERVLLLGPDVVDHAVERMARALETLRAAFVDHLAPIVRPRPAVRWDGAVQAMEEARAEMTTVMRAEVRSAPTVGRVSRARTSV